MRNSNSTRSSEQSAASSNNSNTETVESLADEIDCAASIVDGLLKSAIEYCADNIHSEDDPHHRLESNLRAAFRFNEDVRVINERLLAKQLGATDSEPVQFHAKATPADADTERVRKEALREISNAVNDAVLALSRMDVISRAAITALDYQHEDAFSLKNHMDAFLHAQNKYSGDIRALLDGVFSLIAIAGNDGKEGK